MEYHITTCSFRLTILCMHVLCHDGDVELWGRKVRTLVLLELEVDTVIKLE